MIPLEGGDAQGEGSASTSELRLVSKVLISVARAAGRPGHPSGDVASVRELPCGS